MVKVEYNIPTAPNVLIKRFVATAEDKIFTKYKNFRYDKINNIFNLNNKDFEVIDEATENITKANKVLKNDIESKGESYDNIGEKLKNEGSGTSSQTNTRPIDGSVRTYIMPNQFKNTNAKEGLVGGTIMSIQEKKAIKELLMQFLN